MHVWRYMWRDIGDWIDRGTRLFSPEERAVLLNPPRLVARFSKFAIARALRRAGREAADDIHGRDLELVAWIGDLWRVLAKHYFRLCVDGLDNVPASGPVLFVGNHSGGFLPSEGFFTALAIGDRYGLDRVPYALAHDFLFEDPLLRRTATRLGLLRAGHESAHHAFAAGKCVLVYPGSDLDTFRPFRDRGKIVLGGRKGFLRLALNEGVPIVPVVDAGTHEQFIVLARGDRVAHLLHAHAWLRAEVLPIVLSVPWGLTSGFFPYLPLPAQTTLSFLPPKTWCREDLDRCYRDIEDAMQAELDRLMCGRRFLRGQPGALLAPYSRGGTNARDDLTLDNARIRDDGPRGQEGGRDDARPDHHREQAAHPERHGPA